MIPNAVDFPEILEAFKQHLHSEDASRNTANAYLSDLAYFVSWYTHTISDFHIDEITPTDIRAYREFLQEQIPPTAPATINRRLAALRFGWPHAPLQQWGSRGPGEPITADQANDVWPRSFPSASSTSSEGILGARFLAFPIFLGKYLFHGSNRIEVGIWRKVNEKEVQTLFGESDGLPCDMGW